MISAVSVSSSPFISCVSALYQPQPSALNPLTFYQTDHVTKIFDPTIDFETQQLNLNDYLDLKDDSKFIVKVTGDSMINLGVQDDDMVIVNRDPTLESGQLIIVELNGELMLRQWIKRGKYGYLSTNHPQYKPIDLNQDIDFKIWGVVTTIIHSL